MIRPQSASAAGAGDVVPAGMHLPALLLSQYLFFLTRRPISRSNFHYLESRLRGLQSLREAFQGNGAPPGVGEVIRQLETLHPAGFNRLAASLQFALLPLAQAARFLPADVVVDDTPPPPAWLDRCRRLLLVLGPGIGIGDELILAPLPKWLKAANPELRVVTLSAYGGLWDRVSQVDEVRVYRQHRELLAALRGEPPYDDFDLVVLADFEAPELYRGVASDGRIPSYLEISIGSRSAFFVDNRRRWLHRVHHLTPYGENYYFGLGQLLRRLGLRPGDRDRFAGVFARQGRRPADRYQVFVSPFTSKYEPSQGYWSHLLSALAAGGLPGPLRFVLDSGNNRSTETFARGLQRSLGPPAAADLEVLLAHSGDGRTLSLAGALQELESCHVTVCADSFASHAAPLAGCAALVVARAGTENWRAPHPASFYFDGEAPVGEVASAMRRLLADLAAGWTDADRIARFSQAEVRLAALTGELEALFEADGACDAAQLVRLYGELATLVEAVAAVRQRSAESFDGLFRDSPMGAALRRPGAEDLAGGGPAPALLLHLRDQLEAWRNTNYCKYLRAVAGPGAGLAAAERSG
jgi:hypothetical protein